MNPMIKPLIHIATFADAVSLSTLGATTFQEAFQDDNTPEDMAAYVRENFTPEHLTAELSDPLATFLIAEVSERPVGYTKLRRSEPEPCLQGMNPLELVRLYVLAEYIGQGVGAALMQTCIEQAKDRGHDTLWLGVWEKNIRAIHFYRKWGFEQKGSHVFQLGSDAQTDLLLERHLNMVAVIGTTSTMNKE